MNKHNKLNYNGVTVVDNTPYFMINWFHKLIYCPYSIKIQFKDKNDNSNFKPLQDGIKEHKKVHCKSVNFNLTSSEDENYLRNYKPVNVELGKHYHEYSIVSKTYGLRGKIDEFVVTPDETLVIDDKKYNQLYESDLIQSCAYGLCIEDNPVLNPGGKVRIIIRNTSSGEVFYDDFLSNNYRNKVIKCINYLRQMVNGDVSPDPTGNINKCYSCRLKKFCKYY